MLMLDKLFGSTVSNYESTVSFIQPLKQTFKKGFTLTQPNHISYVLPHLVVKGTIRYLF